MFHTLVRFDPKIAIFWNILECHPEPRQRMRARADGCLSCADAWCRRPLPAHGLPASPLRFGNFLKVDKSARHLCPPMITRIARSPLRHCREK